MPSATPPLPLAMTSSGCSRAMTWSPARTSSFRPPASPTATCWRACAIPAPAARPPNLSSRAPGRAPSGGSPPPMTAPSCGRSAVCDTGRGTSGADVLLAACAQRVPRLQATRARLCQVQSRERAQEAVRDQHVDVRLGGVVDAAAEPECDRGIVVGHLHLDVQPAPVGFLLAMATDFDLEVPVLVAPAPGDEQAAGDAPAHECAGGLHLVFGRPEREQLQRPHEQHP